MLLCVQGIGEARYTLIWGSRGRRERHCRHTAESLIGAGSAEVNSAFVPCALQRLRTMTEASGLGGGPAGLCQKCQES